MNELSLPVQHQIIRLFKRVEGLLLQVEEVGGALRSLKFNGLIEQIVDLHGCENDQIGFCQFICLILLDMLFDQHQVKMCQYRVQNPIPVGRFRSQASFKEDCILIGICIVFQQIEMFKRESAIAGELIFQLPGIIYALF